MLQQRWERQVKLIEAERARNEAERQRRAATAIQAVWRGVQVFRRIGQMRVDIKAGEELVKKWEFQNHKISEVHKKKVW